MGKILVTGGTGNLGSLTIDHLLNKKGIPANEIIALVRDKKRANHLSNKGVELRIGSYDDLDSLKKAFNQVEKLLVISSPSLNNTVRIQQLFNVVMAAKSSQVGHIFFVGLADAEKRLFGLEDVDIAIEHMIRALNIPFTFLRNAVYLDEIAFDVNSAIKNGELTSSTKGNAFNYVLRSDLALANATVLSEQGHENKIYELVSPKLITYPEIASILSDKFGKEISYREATSEETIDNLINSGVNSEAADLLVNSFQRYIAEGQFRYTSNNLVHLIGEQATPIKQAIASLIK